MTVVVARMVGVIFIIFTTLPDDLESFGAYDGPQEGSNE